MIGIFVGVGVVCGACLGALLMAAVSIHRTRDTEAVADAAGVYLSRGTDEAWRQLADAYNRLMERQEVPSYPPIQATSYSARQQSSAPQP